MKVAIVAYGHADNVLCLSNHLSRNADVTLIFVMAGDRFTRSILDWDITGLPFGLTKDREVVDSFLGRRILRYVNPALKILLARTPSLKILKDWKRQNVKYIKEIADFIRSNSYDVVHFNGASGFQIYFHSFLRRTPKVSTVHDYLPHTGESQFLQGMANRLLNRAFARGDYEFIQHYHFLSREFSEFYKVKRDKVHTVYCGPLEIYREFANGIDREDPHTILFFGRVSKYKGIDYLVQAMPTVKKIIPQAKAIIAGAGNLWFHLDDDELFEIHNYHVPNEELVRMIQRAAVVVAPYTDATHSAVLMTAYAFSKPIVASAVGGFPEVIQNDVTGKLVPPKDPAALATSIIELLSDHKKREQMKKNIDYECHKGKLSWNRIAAKTMKVYERACAIA